MYVQHEYLFQDIKWNRIVQFVLSLTGQMTQNYLDNCGEEEHKIVKPLIGMGRKLLNIDH